MANARGRNLFIHAHHPVSEDITQCVHRANWGSCAVTTRRAKLRSNLNAKQCYTQTAPRACINTLTARRGATAEREGKDIAARRRSARVELVSSPAPSGEAKGPRALRTTRSASKVGSRYPHRGAAGNERRGNFGRRISAKIDANEHSSMANVLRETGWSLET